MWCLRTHVAFCLQRSSRATAPMFVSTNFSFVELHKAEKTLFQPTCAVGDGARVQAWELSVRLFSLSR